MMSLFVILVALMGVIGLSFLWAYVVISIGNALDKGGKIEIKRSDNDGIEG